MRFRNGLVAGALSVVALAGAVRGRLVILGPGIQPGGPMIPAPPPAAPKKGAATQPVQRLQYPEAPPADPARIKADIHALGSGRYVVREKAAADILKMGDSVVPYLKKALQGLTTPEMRHLMRRDIRTIARMDLMRGPLITLNLKNVSATTAIMDVCQQAGTTANFWNGNTSATVTLNVKNAPFWRVLALLGRRTQMAPSYGFNNNQPGISFQQGQNTLGPYTSFDGAFAVSLQNATYQRTVDYSQPKGGKSDSFSIQMYLLMLPNKIGNVVMQPVVISRAVDSKGQSLVGPNMANYYNGPMMGAVENCTMNLTYPKHPGKRIKMLKGYIPITGDVGVKMFTVKIGTKKPHTLRISGVHVKFGREKLVNGNWQFTYVMSWPANMSQQTQAIQNQLSNTQFMQGFIAGGAAVPFLNCISSVGGANQTTCTMQTNEKIAKVTFNIYQRPVNLEIPFQFTNVPMP
jgi:hypothetical protein